MSLIKNMDQLAELVVISADIDFYNFAVILDDAQAKYLAPWLGATLLAEIDADHTHPLADSASRALAKYAMSDYMSVNTVRVTDAGNQVISTESKKTAYQWQTKQTQQYWRDAADDHMEELLLLAEAAGKTLAGHLQDLRDAVLIPTSAMLRQYLGYQVPVRAYLSLLPVMREVEELELRQYIPDYEQLHTELRKPTARDYLRSTESARYLLAAIACISAAKALARQLVQYTPEGLRIAREMPAGTSNTEQQQPTPEQLSVLHYSIEVTGRQYLRKYQDLIGQPKQSVTPARTGKLLML